MKNLLRLALLLLTPALMAQTLAIPIPPMLVPTPGVVEPAWSVVCKKTPCTISQPQKTLLAPGQSTSAASSITLAPQLIMALMKGQTLQFACSVPKVNGVPDYNNLTCTLSVKP